jgi:hypothetical protein
MAYRGSRGATKAGFAGLNATLGRTTAGRALQLGAAESLGWSTQGGMLTADATIGSFLGLKETARGARFAGATATPHALGDAMAMAKRYGQSPTKAGMKYLSRGARRAGVWGTAKLGASMAGKTFMNSIPLLGTGAFAYMGYQEGGIPGAVRGIGESIAYSAAFRYAGSLLGGPVLPIAAGVAAVGFGTYALGEAGREHAKQLRELEMVGGNVMDALGSAGAATMRQRAIGALNNTHLNGRMAMGNEALMMHTPFR